ncbi:phosphate acyltransferase PlsX [Bacillus sp. SCS-151]|uniref:phosphate acyltransferase PlsX n=1 Tax=Nanhaiella sioensis TaxID=3115293 RepID=UPI003977F259
MRIAIDAMGGDHAPKEIVLGTLKALEAFPNLHITLIGNEDKIKTYVSEQKRLSIIHANEIIEATDEPVRAVRRKKNASMVLMAKEVKEGRADACISAGNTGALMAAGLFIVGRIDGIDRPALAPTLPTADGRGFIMLDAGANVDAKAQHLLQYAIMGSIYAEKVRGVPSPRVGLLNIGTEKNKGNDLMKQVFPLLEKASLHFIGNVEARDLLEGVADVVITDGFTGNVTLKAIEGTAQSVFSMLKTTLTSNFKSKFAASVLKPQLLDLKAKMDYSEYGGAGLFGLKAPVIKAHGSSDANAIFNAIRQAKDIVDNNVTELIKQQVESDD